ncbi:hypothetical protein WICMUC_005213 [Wickerhamomyces mucosus]|uniref:AMP-activated protein kinase glycogen-binding domain-containing protein n=1 Tax=Wickerhamomyces mucosus TaxID=1378264 RepID=A0A9P8P910_9ASCO|nr:hypothetical protein WICMUC_005213 [Wickerhamomyces mucosus]
MNLCIANDRASSVYVTGTFDNWSQNTRLYKNSNNHNYSTTIEIDPNEKLIFKFIVDGKWLTTSNFKTEKDSVGIENNVLYPEELRKFCNDKFSLPISNDNIPNDVTGGLQYDTESSAFTNISIGDISPSDLEIQSDAIDEEEEDVEDNDLISSIQGTISGDNADKNLISLQEGRRQIKYYTSMSVLSRLTKFLK